RHHAELRAEAELDAAGPLQCPVSKAGGRPPQRPRARHRMLIRTNAAREPPGENCTADGARTGCSALPGSGQARYRHAAHTRQGARLPEERLRMATVASRGHRAISALCSATALSAAVSPSVQKG